MHSSHRLLERLILYVVDQVQDQGGTVSLIKLTKILYLIDVQHYRRYGHTLTGLEWIFHKHGPWAFTLPGVLKRVDIDLGEEEFVTARGYKGRSFSVATPQDISELVGFAVKALVDKVIKAWALEATNVLLGYVYFQTEPMLHGATGEPLQFDTVLRDVAEERITTRIPADKARNMRHRLIEALADIDADLVRVADQRDEAYFEAVRLMDQEGTFTVAPGDSPEVSEELRELLGGHD